MELIRFLSPHIKRAYRIHFELAGLKAHNLSLQAALDSSPTAILLIDHDCACITMNLAAQTIFDQKDGLIVRHRGCKQNGAKESTLLDNLLSHAGPKCGNGLGLAGAMVVQRKKHLLCRCGSRQLANCPSPRKIQ